MWHAVVRARATPIVCARGCWANRSAFTALVCQGGTCMYVALHSLKPGCMATSTYYVGATGSQNQGAGGSQ